MEKKGARLVGASRALRRGAQPPLTIPEIRCDYFAPNIQLQPITTAMMVHKLRERVPSSRQSLEGVRVP